MSVVAGFIANSWLSGKPDSIRERTICDPSSPTAERDSTKHLGLTTVDVDERTEAKTSAMLDLVIWLFVVSVRARSVISSVAELNEALVKLLADGEGSEQHSSSTAGHSRLMQEGNGSAASAVDGE